LGSVYTIDSYLVIKADLLGAQGNFGEVLLSGGPSAECKESWKTPAYIGKKTCP